MSYSLRNDFIDLYPKEMTMSLELTRKALSDELAGKTRIERKEDRPIQQLAQAWWREYKAWEREDRFLTAIRQKRMSIRQAPLSLTYKATRARRFSQKQEELYKNFPHNVGIDGIKLRLDPKNFVNNREDVDRAERTKYKLGFHDLSASLLNPYKRFISKQQRWKWGPKAKDLSFVFVPLPIPADLELFHQLNTLTKKSHTDCPLLYDLLCDIRSRMTRIKLADHADMGATFRDISPKGSTPDFRYGVTRPRTGSGSPTGEDLNKYQLAKSYTDIATPESKGSNEVIITYREHASPRFPIFADWDKPAGKYLCHPEEESSNYIQDQVIFDDWEKTQCY